ncbi:MAG: enolase [archaeon GW2011_AR5]|nr:MAG: enolase [archaeon GW2011_AR5]
MKKIKSLHAREVLNSRGMPAVEAELNNGTSSFRAISPEGASKGKYEAVEIKDGGHRYHGMGVKRAVENINKIISGKLAGAELDQRKIDKMLCALAGDRKWKLGGNATTAVSMAAWKADSPKYKSIPVPFSLIVEGGAHAGNDLAVQEFMITPLKTGTFAEGMRAVSEIYYTLEKTVVKKYGKSASNVGYEGGFALQLNDTKTVLSLMTDAIDEAGYQKEVKIAIDAAATQFFNGNYSIDGKIFTASGLCDYYLDLVKIFPVFSIEDPFHEEDFASFAMLKKRAKRLMVVGDDLTVTNVQRIKKATDSCNALIVKVNQVGTVTEALEAVELARKDGWEIIVSHRGGDSEDTFISDFSANIGAFGAKFGAPMRGERTAKYNQLLRLEENGLPYAGKKFKL